MHTIKKLQLQRDTVNRIESIYGLKLCIKANQKEMFGFFSLENDPRHRQQDFQINFFSSVFKMKCNHFMCLFRW